MTQTTPANQTVHDAARMYADEFKQGKLSRREFLARTTALGVSATTAYALGGIAMPSKAAAQGTPTRGGTIRM